MTFFINILTLVAVSTAHAAHDPSTCIRFLSPDLSATLQLENQIKDKIAARTAKANAAVPILIRDDGGEPTLLTTGIKKLFTREILQFDVDSARNRISQLAQAWTGSHRKIMTKNVESKLRGPAIESMRLEILEVKNRYNDLISKESKSQPRSETKSLVDKIYDEYSSGLRSEPNFQEMRNFLLSINEQMMAELMKRYPLAPGEQSRDLQVLIENPYFFQDPVAKGKDEKYQFPIRQSQAVGVFELDIATLVLRLSDKDAATLLPEQAFVATFLHGCGTNRSNVASWAALFPMLAQNGTQPFAYNMPGSVGECGIGINSLRSSQEVGLYLNNLVENARETVEKLRLPNGHKALLPQIIVGRSAGSTQGLMSALINHMAHGYTSIKGADLYFLTSFSDPRTMVMQDENLKAQISRGDIKGIVHDAIQHFDSAANGFQHHLETLKKTTRPNVLADFGDDVVFVQGEADQDGQFHDGSGRTAFSNLKDYRDQFAPYGHIYEIEDPLKRYRGKGIIDHFSYDSLEATHFLYSNRPNITEKTRDEFPMEIPEADLPKLRDQSYEVFALKFAMMDYLIDLSPKISAKKDELEHRRFLLTGSNQPFSYLNWYIKEKLDHKVPQFDDLTLEKIINDDSIHPSRRSGVPGRVKKVYNYILNEAERIKQLEKAQLQNQTEPAA